MMNNVRLAQESLIFVFGSNLAGRHGAGAALSAAQFFGATYGKGEGLHGRSYALPTKDRNIKTLPLALVAQKIKDFLYFARARQDCNFLVTKVGCGLAGFKDEQIAPLFADAPSNCILPAAWVVPGRHVTDITLVNDIRMPEKAFQVLSSNFESSSPSKGSSPNWGQSRFTRFNG